MRLVSSSTASSAARFLSAASMEASSEVIRVVMSVDIILRIFIASPSVAESSSVVCQLASPRQLVTTRLYVQLCGGLYISLSLSLSLYSLLYVLFPNGVYIPVFLVLMCLCVCVVCIYILVYYRPVEIR